MRESDRHYVHQAIVSRLVHRALTELDDRCAAAGGVRDVFGPMGIKGIPADPERCPLGRYLETVLKIGRIYVCAEKVYVCADGQMGVEVRPTSGVADFIIDFDMGKYPEMIEEITYAPDTVAGQLPANGVQVQGPDLEQPF